MTLQERELLVTFLQQMGQAQIGQKDSEAETLIRESCARQPDAAYLLVQRAIGLDVALQSAQAQVAKLQAEVNQLQPNSRSGFLDSSNAWGRSAPAVSATPATAGPATSAPLTRAATQTAAAPPAAASSWGSGMLGTVATTAAGVVAGSFLFQGIQGMMGHHNTPANPLAETPPVQTTHELASNNATSEEYSDYADSGDSNMGDSDTA